MNAQVATLVRLGSRFRRHTGGSIAPLAALTLIPIMTAAGAAIDYSRANNFKSSMQGDAPAFVEVGEAGIAVDHAMRRQLAIQRSW